MAVLVEVAAEVVDVAMQYGVGHVLLDDSPLTLGVPACTAQVGDVEGAGWMGADVDGSDAVELVEDRGGVREPVEPRQTDVAKGVACLRGGVGVIEAPPEVRPLSCLEPPDRLLELAAASGTLPASRSARDRRRSRPWHVLLGHLPDER